MVQQTADLRGKAERYLQRKVVKFSERENERENARAREGERDRERQREIDEFFS